MQKNKLTSAHAKLILTAITLIFAAGCATSQKDTDPSIAKKPGSRQQVRDDFADPQAPDSQTPVATSTEGQPAQQEEKRVAVILGPGGYKTFAHTGVIKEMRKANIPIHKIVGIEWGSLIAALYAQRGQINEAEWKLYKLERVDLDNRSFFARKEAKSVKDLEGYLAQNLDKKDIRELAVGFSCPSLSLNQGTLAWFEQGPLTRAVESCLASPPLFRPQRDAVAGLFSATEAVAKLRKEGYNVIVLVNVLGEGNLFDKAVSQEDYSVAVLWNEARRNQWLAKGLVTDVVDVNTRGINMGDFESRKILMTAGEAAGERLAKAMITKYGF